MIVAWPVILNSLMRNEIDYGYGSLKIFCLENNKQRVLVWFRHLGAVGKQVPLVAAGPVMTSLSTALPTVLSG
jgi:hypothetical protein